MRILRRQFSLWGRVCGAGAIFLCAGCMEMFQIKQRVIVDAICAPGAAKPAGLSYRLMIRKSVATSQPVQLPVIKACVDASLIRAGLYEAPPTVPSDIFIEINFGMDTTTRIDPAARESFLQFSARSNHQHQIDSSLNEEELWDVRVAIMGLAGRLETAMPLLATVASNNMGADTHTETVLQVADNSPEVASVRQMALQSLTVQTKSTTQAVSASATATAGATTAK